VSPVLADTNQTMENICSQHEDTSLYETNAIKDDFEALEAEEDAQFWQNAQIWPEETNSEDLSEQIMARETEVMPETQEIPETQDVSTDQSDQTYDRNS